MRSRDLTFSEKFPRFRETSNLQVRVQPTDFCEKVSMFSLYRRSCSWCAHTCWCDAQSPSSVPCPISSWAPQRRNKCVKPKVLNLALSLRAKIKIYFPRLPAKEDGTHMQQKKELLQSTTLYSAHSETNMAKRVQRRACRASGAAGFSVLVPLHSEPARAVLYTWNKRAKRNILPSFMPGMAAHLCVHPWITRDGINPHNVVLSYSVPGLTTFSFLPNERGA